LKKRRDRVLFYGYLCLVLLFTSIHNTLLLGGALLVLFLLSYKEFFYLFKKSLLSVVMFSGFISLTYLLSGIFREIDYHFLLLLNLRVFLLSYLSFYIFEQINIFNIFSKRLSRVLALAFSQIHQYKRFFIEFKHGTQSRWASFTYSKWLLSLKSMIFYFLNKSLHNSQEITMGMRSRGFFHD